MTKQVIFTENAPAAIGPYSQGIVAPIGSTMYVSGQLGIDPETSELVSENFEEQVRQAFTNLSSIVYAAGGTLHNIVKLTLYVTDLNNFGIANSVMSELIPAPFPARSTIEVSALPKGAQFEVECIIVV